MRALFQTAVLGTGLAIAMLQVPAHSAEPEPLPPTPPEIEAIQLPEGRLLPISHSDTSAYFVDLDRTTHRGAVADFWKFVVYDPPMPSRGMGVAQAVEHERVDCDRDTHETLAVKGFDAAGVMVIWLPRLPVQPIPIGSAYYFVAAQVCGRLVLPLDAALQGHAAALAFARDLLKTDTRRSVS